MRLSSGRRTSRLVPLLPERGRRASSDFLRIEIAVSNVQEPNPALMCPVRDHRRRSSEPPGFHRHPFDIAEYALPRLRSGC